MPIVNVIVSIKVEKNKRAQAWQTHTSGGRNRTSANDRVASPGSAPAI